MATQGQHSRRLRSAMRRRSLSFRRLAKIVPAHWTELHRIAQGKTEPDLRLAVALEREIGLPVETWPSLRQPVQQLFELRKAAA